MFRAVRRLRRLRAPRTACTFSCGPNMKMIVAFNFKMLMGRTKPGRRPLENRAAVRNAHVTIKMSTMELEALHKLVALRGAHSVSMYVRELVAKDARRRGLKTV